MSFANKYFDRVKTLDEFLDLKASNSYSIISVIPVFNEPDFLETLNSLQKNIFVEFNVLVIVVVNSSENSSSNIIKQNRITISEVENFSLQDRLFDIQIINACLLKHKQSGVGWARKIGMDAALKLFDNQNNPDGIILSLDADTRVKENYFSEVHNFFSNNNKIEAISIKFEHFLDKDRFGKDIIKAIKIYELYLHYYVNALRFAGHPHSYHTIGSAFAVRAKTYAKHGGMVTNQSGEDFYFLHKIIPNGNFATLSSTCVYPSPRITDRVVFGTGIAVKQIINDYKFDYPTYCLQAFLELKIFNNLIPEFYKNDFNVYRPRLNNTLTDFMLKNKIQQRIDEIRLNTKGKDAFIKRFYNWFNGFRVVKYLNFYHKVYHKESIFVAANQLLQYKHFKGYENLDDLLNIYRKI